MSITIHYVEPNNLDFKNEDLCIGVKLEVDVPGRPLSAKVGEIEMNWRPLIDNVDLFGNKDGDYLTTSYSDISSLDPHNGGNMDSIGIEYINIRYNSWMFPEVDIKFIDLRGNALMNPMEARRDDRSKNGSFLNALFSFPYPLFKLTVKGYYGKPVTYKLTVRDVRSNFNAATGNFEIAVKFIGYMFGYLNDIPMQYLLIAPYINYGGEDADLGTFKYSNSKIPTFTEFISTITQAVKNSSQDTNLTINKNGIKNLTEGKEILYRIKEGILRVKEDLESQNVFTYKVEEKDENSNAKKYILTKREQNDNNEIITNEVFNDFIKTMNNNKNNVIKLVNEYHETPIGQKYHIDSLSIISLPDFEFTKDRETNISTCIVEWEWGKDENIVGCAITLVSGELETENENLKAQIDDIYSTAIGWKPTIGNVVEMVLAHLHKLYRNMERCMKNIDGKRSMRDLSRINYTTDCNGSKEQTVPPFPLLTNKDKKYLWIGDTDSPTLSNFDERWIVESVINGSVSYAEKAAKAVVDFDTVSKWVDFPKGGIPTLLSDLYGGMSQIPYESKSLESVDGGIPEALKVFAKRLALRYLFNQGSSSALPLKSFAEAEAINLFNRNSHTEKRNILKNSSIWKTPSRASDLVQNYLNQFLKNYNIENENHYSISYSTYANKDDIGGNGRNGDLSCFNQDIESDIFRISWSEKTSVTSLNGYDVTMDSVMSWLGSNNGLLEGYSDVFPQIIKRKYDYFNDDIKQVKGGFLLDIDVKTDEEKLENVLENKGLMKIPHKYRWVCGKLDDNHTTIERFFEGINFDKIHSFKPYNYVSYKHVDFISWVKEQGGNIEKDILIKEFLKQLGIYNASGDNTYEIFNLNIYDKVIYNGVFKMPLLLYAYCGFLCKERHDNFNEDLESIKPYLKVFTERYDEVSKNLKEKILQIVECCTDEYKQDIQVVGEVERFYLYVLPDKAKRILQDLFNEDVVIYNLHGKHQSPFNKKNRNKGGKNADDKVCSICITGQDILKDNDNEEIKENAVDYFIEKIQKLCDEVSNGEENLKKDKQTSASSDKKLSVYLTLKELYDRWKFGAWRSDGNDANKQDFNITLDNFVFIDSHYCDIKNDHLVNIDKFAKLIRSVMEGGSDISVCSFIYEICKICDIQLSALPVNMYDYLSSLEKMEEVFTAYPYMAIDDSAMQTTYVGVYTHKPSQHLNLTSPYNGYDDDGLDFMTNDFVQEEGYDVNRRDIPVFGVTYGLSEQRFFKNISVGMDSPKATAHSLMSELLISQQGSSGANSLGFEAHDIFDVYATKSYTCKVEMMGDAQIMPMTYFQLNNIPLFKGGYYIIHVEHNITKNGMTTSFEGVRMNKNRFDLKPKDAPNTTSLYATSIMSQIGVNGHDEKNPTFTHSNIKIRTNIPYSKDTTYIMIDAGHDMTTNGKQSPQLSVAVVENVAAIDSDLSDTVVWDTTSELTPDLGNDSVVGTMKANYPDSSSAFIPNSGINSKGKSRYREYWGNRKIAEALKKELIKRGYPGDNIEIVSTTGLTASEITNFSSKVNSRYNEKNGNCILISIHSNANGDGETWVDANYWSVYRQSNEYIKYYSTYKEAPHVDVSTALARCIGNAAEKAFKNIPWSITNNGIGNVVVHSEPKVFSESYQGIRPTTYSLAPTVLTENLFHTSQMGVRLLGSTEGPQFFANLHADGIDDFFRQVAPTNYVEEVNNDEIEQNSNMLKKFKNLFKKK